MIVGTRVSSDGTVLDPAGIEISPDVDYGYRPAVDWDGTNYFVVWESFESRIYGARVSSSGTVLDPSAIAISNTDDASVPALAWNGSSHLIVWQDTPPENTDILGARVDAGGHVLDTTAIPISIAAGHQQYADVAGDGENWLVVWQDGRASTQDIYGARVSSDGTVLEPQGLPISVQATTNENEPAVAWGASSYLVSWNDGRSGDEGLYGSRVGSDGTVLDPAGIVISAVIGWDNRSALAWSGSNWLVAWEDERGSNSDIYAARVSGSGGGSRSQWNRDLYGLGLPVRPGCDSHDIRLLRRVGGRAKLRFRGGRRHLRNPRRCRRAGAGSRRTRHVDRGECAGRSGGRVGRNQLPPRVDRSPPPGNVGHLRRASRPGRCAARWNRYSGFNRVGRPGLSLRRLEWQRVSRGLGTTSGTTGRSMSTARASRAGERCWTRTGSRSTTLRADRTSRRSRRAAIDSSSPGGSTAMSSVLGSCSTDRWRIRSRSSSIRATAASTARASPGVRIRTSLSGKNPGARTSTEAA